MLPPPRLLERLSRVAPLGLRFVDDGTGAVITDGLSVEISAADRLSSRVTARPNRSGTFVAARMPGAPAADVEFGEGDDEFWQRVGTRPYIVEVADRRHQYQPFRFELALPARGHAAPLCLLQQSPPSTVIPLFGTASRLVPAGMAVIRAELRHPVMAGGETTLQPAAWALVEARVAGMAPVRGLADAQGRVAVVLPYPEPAPRPARPASPPFPGGAALVDQEWSVGLSAWFDAIAPAPAVPDLCRTLAQAPATLWADGRRQQALGDQVLRFGRELVVRSQGVDDGALVITSP